MFTSKGNTNMKLSAIDVFCGIGGLSYGLKKAKIPVAAGIDIDETCKYAYEKNIKGKFISKDITELNGKDLLNDFWQDPDTVRILVGCAPCQPFSSHTFKNKSKKKSKKWFLIEEFKRLINETNPQIISMENVPNLIKQSVFIDFVNFLEDKKYNVTFSKVYCPDYGIPQKRRRLVLLASKLGEIKLIPHTHSSENYKTTRDAIGDLPLISSGETHESDPLHKTTKLSELNMKRIRASRPNGSWKDWDENLKLECHKKESGSSYVSVYGRMSWDEPSPTITTQFYNFGTGRFGHPEQDRALSIREASLLQTFPMKYKFCENENEVYLTRLGRHIGNAVPVDLGFVIGKSIKKHLKIFSHE